MKRVPHVAMMLVAVALVAADAGGKKKAGDDEKIQGIWHVAERYHKGKKEGFVGNLTYKFSGKKLIVPSDAMMGGAAVFAFELRPDKKPGEMDITARGDEKISRWIYELSGDTLTICFPGRGKLRPDTIGTAADDERRVLVFKRWVKGDKGDGRPNEIEKLKQVIAKQQKQIRALEARVAKLEESRLIEVWKAAGGVRPSGRKVSPKTELKAGDKVLVESGGIWWQGEILRLSPDGNVRIHYEGWGAEWDEDVPRTRLQLPTKGAAKKP